METKHIVMFSTGAGSAYLAKYVIDKYGKENTVLLMTDTKWEDEDNYRFLEDVTNFLGVPMTFHNDGRTPEDIFRESLYFGNFGTAPCSKELKMKQTFLFAQDLIAKGVLPILYFGIGYGEIQRAPRIAFNYLHNVDVFEDGIETRFPLVGEVDGEPVSAKHLFHGTDDLEKDKLPRLKSGDIYERLEKQNFKVCSVEPKRVIPNEWGIELPRMYKHGFSHANCSGRCIKGGLGHYKTLYEVWPERYLEQEQMERDVIQAREAKGGKGYTILSTKDAFKRKVPMSLEKYRKEVLEKQDQLDIFNFIDEDEKPCECVF